MDAETLKQIARQCKVVAHLATTLAAIHRDYEKIFEDGGKGPEHIADIVGSRTAHLMETLGDILSGMDAVTEDDEWTDPIFREAQKRWPAAT